MPVRSGVRTFSDDDSSKYELNVLVQIVRPCNSFALLLSPEENHRLNLNEELSSNIRLCLLIADGGLLSKVAVEGATGFSRKVLLRPPCCFCCCFVGFGCCCCCRWPLCLLEELLPWCEPKRLLSSTESDRRIGCCRCCREDGGCVGALTLARRGCRRCSVVVETAGSNSIGLDSEKKLLIHSVAQLRASITSKDGCIYGGMRAAMKGLQKRRKMQGEEARFAFFVAPFFSIARRFDTTQNRHHSFPFFSCVRTTFSFFFARRFCTSANPQNKIHGFALLCFSLENLNDVISHCKILAAHLAYPLSLSRGGGNYSLFRSDYDQTISLGVDSANEPVRFTSIDVSLKDDNPLQSRDFFLHPLSAVFSMHGWRLLA